MEYQLRLKDNKTSCKLNAFASCFFINLYTKLMKPLCVVGAEGRDTLHIWNFGNMPIFAWCASAYPSVVLRCVQKMVIHDADCMKPKFPKTKFPVPQNSTSSEDFEWFICSPRCFIWKLNGNWTHVCQNLHLTVLGDGERNRSLETKAAKSTANWLCDTDFLYKGFPRIHGQEQRTTCCLHPCSELPG